MSRVLSTTTKESPRNLSEIKGLLEYNKDLWEKKLISSTEDHRYIQGVYQVILDMKELMDKMQSW